MCGIMGYVGHRSALPILLDGLRRLEYRGYDSAGVAVLNDGHIEVRKTAGKLAQLTEITSGPGLLHGTVGIGHTRWATHGLPTDANAHPHSDCGGRVVVIHNGIIENFLPLKEELQARGHTFRSDTDTEVIAHLIEEELYGHEQPGTLERLDGSTVAKQPLRITWDAEMAEKGGYPHFMLKEIHEQPRALQETMMGRLDAPGGAPELDGVSYSPEFVRGLRKLWITACGTAYHAGLVGRWVVEHWAKVPVEPELASELRYRDALIDPQTLTVAISQSGETADTLAAAREARKRGTRLAAITNVVGSTLSREADDVLYVRAGPEIAVASSKAYITMLVALQMLALDLAVRRGTVTPPRVAHIIQAMKALPGKAQEVLLRESEVASLAARLADREHMFFIGRGLDYAVAQEGSLKLKEISYLHSEALADGELKHGTLALVTPGVPVFALVTQRHVYEKTLSNIQEVKARGGLVIAVAYDRDTEITKHTEVVLRMRDTLDDLAPVLAVIPLQLFAYHVARERGNDIDQPRNLAKSVTVE